MCSAPIRSAAASWPAWLSVRRTRWASPRRRSLTSMLIGGALGLIAGYSNRWYSQMILRLADIIMSFPSLLLALIVLYTLGPSIPNLIIVLAITRIPIYLRTTRAEVLELRERMFVSAAKIHGRQAAPHRAPPHRTARSCQR